MTMAFAQLHAERQQAAEQTATWMTIGTGAAQMPPEMCAGPDSMQALCSPHNLWKQRA